jgi:septal ring factor EnvC (AmiA/AmiB activator)
MFRTFSAKSNQVFAVCFLVFLLSGPMPCPLSATRTTPEATDQLQTELDAINLQIDYLKLKVQENSGQINQLEKKIASKKKEIAELKEQISAINIKKIHFAEQIGKLEAEIALGQQQMRELMTRFRARLVQLHKIKQGTLLGSIFSAKNLNSFLNRFQMVKYLLENDKELLTEMKNKNEQLVKNSAQLVEKEKQMASMQQDLDQKKARVDNENLSLEAMLKTVVLEKKLFVSREKKLAGARSDLEKEIAKIEAGREDKNQSFEQELKKTAPKSVQPQKLPEDAPEAARVMKFSWPANRQSIKTFARSGNEKAPALRIELQGEAEILAAGRGKVLYKGEISGLGNVIILGHERGFSTVYANLDEMWVGLGQIVNQGETIARVFSGGPGMHFEIRFGGKKQRPADYLPAIDQQ